MDADCIGDHRDHFLSRREKRWSMNSQRLEEIVALLMTPISSDARRHFDTDLAALLEEYLTEAGLHALDAGEEADAADVVAPNYSELALLLQQSAAIYGRKVDFLYQNVIDVSEALHANSLYEDEVEPVAIEEDGSGGSDSPPASRSGARAAPRGAQFARTGSQRGRLAAREAGAPRPHPTLPRVFMELEPRLLTDASRALRDYDGEIIGLLDDFQASLELSHSRMLVEDDSASPLNNEQPLLRPISLVELQQAIEAAAPPLLEPLSPASSLASAGSPLRASTPLPSAAPPTPPEPAAPPDAAADTPPPARRERKRRHSAANIEDFREIRFRYVITEEVRQKLAEEREFDIPGIWVNKRVTIRKGDILCSRWQLREQESPRASSPADSGVEAGAFRGWSAAEAGHAAALVKGGRASADSSDDGFFELSSVGDASDARAPELLAWQHAVLARAAAAERRGLDVRALGGAVLRALPPPPGPPLHADELLRRTAHTDAEVSHVLLSTLFLANAGNVAIVPGAPLSVNSFSLQLLRSELPAAAAPDDPFLPEGSAP
ncbi:hypothetical protein PYW08_003497 [Mythimna loreyi]|uniref:Uncharacterized protein n=1 Tax=Mythimna loreyi TaxID=667449 RepID=A0ACC2QRX1_9NEOP|nr:hypothetical protein PYW08_003497 [Mythimna loreyi]